MFQTGLPPLVGLHASAPSHQGRLGCRRLAQTVDLTCSVSLAGGTRTVLGQPCSAITPHSPAHERLRPHVQVLVPLRGTGLGAQPVDAPCAEAELGLCPANHHPEAWVLAGNPDHLCYVRSLPNFRKGNDFKTCGRSRRVAVSSTACMRTWLSVPGRCPWTPWTQVWPLNSFANAALAPWDKGHRAA